MTRNVVLLVLDSVRQDVFAEHASRVRERSSLVYDQCRAASTWSVPSHASMLTGELPSEHGIHTHSRSFDGLDRADTVFADLPDHTTLGASANVFASSAFAFDRYFDEFREVTTGQRFPRGLDPNAFYEDGDRDGLSVYSGYLRAALTHDHPLRSLANGVLAQVNVTTRDAPIPKLIDDGASALNRTMRDLVADAAEPYFLFANYEDCHIPLRPTRGYDDDLYDAPADWSTTELGVWDIVGDVDDCDEYLAHHRDLYDSAAEYLDRTVAAVVDSLRVASDREVTVVVTADHGENLGYEADDRLWAHKSSLSEALLHVPFYVVNPPSTDVTTDGYLSHLALRDLLVGFARGETRDLVAERPVAEIVGMSAGPDPPDDYEYWDRAQRCAYDGERKWVWDSLGGATTYELDHDRPCWQRRIEDDADVPDWAMARFDAEIAEYKARAESGGEDVDVDAATESRLEDLGYL